jgi:hypothetical protein
MSAAVREEEGVWGKGSSWGLLYSSRIIFDSQQPHQNNEEKKGKGSDERN